MEEVLDANQHSALIRTLPPSGMLSKALAHTFEARDRTFEARPHTFNVSAPRFEARPHTFDAPGRSCLRRRILLMSQVEGSRHRRIPSRHDRIPSMPRVEAVCGGGYF